MMFCFYKHHTRSDMFDFIKRKLQNKGSNGEKTKQSQYIKSVMEKTGWNYDYAEEQMKKAKEKTGIIFRDYDKYNFFESLEEDQEAEYKKILEKKERLRVQKENNIKSVMEKTGWSYDDTVKKIKEAKARLGITYKDYNKYDFYKVPEKNQKIEYQKILEKKERLRVQKEKNIKSVMEKTGWNYEDTVKKIEDAKSRLGITYKDYNKYDFHNLNNDEQKVEYMKIIEKKQSTKSKSKEKDKAIVRVMKATGWDYDFTKSQIIEAKQRTNCTYKEFCIYKFYELDKSEQERVFLIHESKKISKKYDTDRKFIKMLRNKSETNKYFSNYIKRAWCVNTETSYEDFIKIFHNSDKIFYKPLGGNRGIGAEAFCIDENNAKQIFDKLSTYPVGVVEEYVVQHAEMNRLCPHSVNTVRIVTISSNTTPVRPDGEMMDIAYAALRIGGGNSIVDNFHSGGMVAAVDLETGELVTDAADMEDNIFVKHPTTGTTIKGFKIPYFREAVDYVINACKQNKIEGYLGWDIAITDQGPELIEVNATPGVVLLSMPYVAEKRGMKHIMMKYL